MPLYEEKLISPLAVRFSQEHIRPVFQSGIDLDSTIRQIRTKPGNGSYDVILEAPFEPIEIIRWQGRDSNGEEAEARHWFSFDNRRLYCLQRAAAAWWPKKVAAVVQALYAASEGSRRKDTTSTAGRSVAIGHSPKLLTGRWDWRAEVAGASCSNAEAMECQVVVTRDDASVDVPDLADAPAPPSMLELFFQSGDAGNGAGDCAVGVFAASEVVSTTDPSSPRSAEDSDGSDFDAALSTGLCGSWQGQGGDRFEVRISGDGWACTCVGGAGGRRPVPLRRAADSDLVWWGRDWSMCAAAAEVRAQAGTVQWYKQDGGWTPAATWTWLGGAADGQVVTGGRPSGRQRGEQPQAQSSQRRQRQQPQEGQQQQQQRRKQLSQQQQQQKQKPQKQMQQQDTKPPQQQQQQKQRARQCQKQKPQQAGQTV